MRWPSRLSALAALLVLPGCATTSIDLAPSHPDAPWVPSTGAHGEILAAPDGSGSTAHVEGFVLPPNALAAATPETSLPDRSHAYTLPELIDLAQSSNPETRIAWEQARKAALDVGIAKASYLPNISASVVGAHQRSDSRISAPGLSVSNDETLEGALSAISLQWLLFDFGERDAIVDAAGQLSTAANIAFTATHQRVIYNVCLAYYAYEAALARADNASKALQNAHAVESAADARFAHGIGTKVEVAQAHQATAQSTLAEVQAVGSRENAYAILVAAMGISSLTPLRIAPLPVRAVSPAIDGSLERIVADALARRPDVLAAYALHEASLARVRAAKAEYLPKIFLGATGSYASTNLNLSLLPGIGQGTPTGNLSDHGFGSTVLLGITVPIYDGGTRRAMESQARSDVERTNAALSRARDEATREIVSAANAVKTSVAAMGAASALIAAAQTTFDAALAAYQREVGSVTDVTRAQIQLLEAANAYSDAYSATRASAATLAFTIGALGTAPVD